MKVLVTGGDGFIGRHLCAELVDRGHDITSLSRSPDPSVLPQSVETVAGDVADYESIEGAFEGQDAVVHLAALSPVFQPRGGDEMHDRVNLGGTRNAVRAAEEHGVDRFVHQSGLGVDPDAPTHYHRSKGRAETVVRESDLDWVIFRPSVVFGEGDEFVPFTKLVTTPYLAGLPGGGRMRFQPIFVGDLVPMLATAVEDDERVGQVYELGGPEVLSLAEVTKLAYRAEGKPVRIVPVPMPIARIGLTLAGLIPWIPLGPDQYRSLKGVDNTVADNDVEAFGVDPAELTTLGAYLGVER